MHSNVLTLSRGAKILQRVNALHPDHRFKIQSHTDKLFVCLLAMGWLAGISVFDPIRADVQIPVMDHLEWVDRICEREHGTARGRSIGFLAAHDIRGGCECYLKVEMSGDVARSFSSGCLSYTVEPAIESQSPLMPIRENREVIA